MLSIGLMRIVLEDAAPRGQPALPRPGRGLV